MPPVLRAALVVAVARVGARAAGVCGDALAVAQVGAALADALPPHALHPGGATPPAGAACRVKARAAALQAGHSVSNACPTGPAAASAASAPRNARTQAGRDAAALQTLCTGGRLQARRG